MGRKILRLNFTDDDNHIDVVQQALAKCRDFCFEEYAKHRNIRSKVAHDICNLLLSILGNKTPHGGHYYDEIGKAAKQIGDSVVDCLLTKESISPDDHKLMMERGLEKALGERPRLATKVAELFNALTLKYSDFTPLSVQDYIRCEALRPSKQTKSGLPYAYVDGWLAVHDEMVEIVLNENSIPEFAFVVLSRIINNNRAFQQIGPLCLAGMVAWYAEHFITEHRPLEFILSALSTLGSQHARAKERNVTQSV